MVARTARLLARLRCMPALFGFAAVSTSSNGNSLVEVLPRAFEIAPLPQRKTDVGQGRAEPPLQLGVGGLGGGEALDQSETFLIALQRCCGVVAHRQHVDEGRARQCELKLPVDIARI